jgi:hypothetical protein
MTLLSGTRDFARRRRMARACGLPAHSRPNQDVLRDALEVWPNIMKAGLSLEIDDLPDGYQFKRRVIEHEAKFWGPSSWTRLGTHRRFYIAPIDTTFCMMRTRDPYAAYEPARRAGRPYTARHLPWYMTPETITAEYRHYLANVGFKTGIYWTTLAASEFRKPAPQVHIPVKDGMHDRHVAINEFQRSVDDH